MHHVQELCNPSSIMTESLHICHKLGGYLVSSNVGHGPMFGHVPIRVPVDRMLPLCRATFTPSMCGGE